MKISTFTFSTAPPSFTATPPQYVEAKEGGSTLLSCSAQGNPKPMISWLREGEELVTNAKYSVRIQINNGHSSVLESCANIEAGFVPTCCHPWSPSVQEVCYELINWYSLIKGCSVVELQKEYIFYHNTSVKDWVNNMWCWSTGKNTFWIRVFFYF